MKAELTGYRKLDHTFIHSQSARLRLTQNNCSLQNSFKIHFYDANGVPCQAKELDLPQNPVKKNYFEAFLPSKMCKRLTFPR